jgi:hypothetical protein
VSYSWIRFLAFVLTVSLVGELCAQDAKKAPAKKTTAKKAAAPAPKIVARQFRRVSAPPLPVSNSSLADQIDALLLEAARSDQITPSALCSDSEFIRRAYLDLNGTVPSAEQTRDFLGDSATVDKREALIDGLLSRPQYARRMQYLFDEVLIERRPGASIPDKEWRNWLRKQFANNRPWNEVAHKILAADGVGPDRPAAKFYLVRKIEPNLVTRDIGRVFLGVDLECAQCHDHPIIDDYLQRHYYGITAFLKRSYLFTDSKSKQKQLGEKAENTPVKFTSVFTSEESTTMPRLMNLPTLYDPNGTLKKYIVAPVKTKRGVPQYSRRKELAAEIVSYDNGDFRRNIVNRLWAMVMGRGIVEPLDVRHSANPPSHPEVLELLAEEFMQHDYDVRWFVRQLAVTKTYQRACKNSHKDASQHFACGLLKPLSPEQLAWSLMEVTGLRARTLVAQQTALVKKDPKGGPTKKDDPTWQEAAVHDGLKSSTDQFTLKFGRQGGQKTDFESTSEQALFLINGALVQSWVAPTSGNLTERLAKLQDSTQLADELYITLLNRHPTADEVADIGEYLKIVENKNQAVQEIAWAILTSAEFRFNH